MKKKIKLEAEIDMTVKPAEVRVKAVDGIWEDYGHYLEVISFMAYQAMKYKEMTEEEIMEYTINYISEAIKDYKIKSD